MQLRVACKRIRVGIKTSLEVNSAVFHNLMRLCNEQIELLTPFSLKEIIVKFAELFKLFDTAKNFEYGHQDAYRPGYYRCSHKTRL